MDIDLAAWLSTDYHLSVIIFLSIVALIIFFCFIGEVVRQRQADWNSSNGSESERQRLLAEQTSQVSQRSSPVSTRATPISSLYFQSPIEINRPVIDIEASYNDENSNSNQNVPKGITPLSPQRLLILLDQYTQSIDDFIRSREDFHSPGYMYNIDKLRRELPPPKELKIDRDRNDFVEFLRSRSEFHVNPQRTFFELTTLTPHRNSNERVYGYYHCVKKYCDTFWESDESYADKFQRCKKCNCKVYPYRQHPLIDGTSENLNTPNVVNTSNKSANNSLNKYVGNSNNNSTNSMVTPTKGVDDSPFNAIMETPTVERAV